MSVSVNTAVSGGGSGGGSSTWGGITGTLSNQTDLQNALNAKATYNAPVTISVNTTLTAALHSNRTLFVDTAGVVLTLNADATDGWTPSVDSLYIETVGAGTFTWAGTATVNVPTGTSRDPTLTVGGVVGLDHTPTANTWNVTSATTASAGATVDQFAVMTSRFGIITPSGDNATSWSSFGCSAPAAFDTSTLTAPGITNDALGNLKTMHYVGTNAVNRGAGWYVNQTFQLQVAETDVNPFPIATVAAIGDASPAAGGAFIGFGPIPTLTAEASTLFNMIGFGFDSTDTNWQIMYNAGTGTATKVDLGASFPRTTRLPILFVITRTTVTGNYTLYAKNLSTGVTSAVTTASGAKLPASDRNTWGVYRWALASAFAADIYSTGLVRGKLA